MDLLRRFTLVGAIATLVDVLSLLLLSEVVSLSVWAADTLAVTVATAVSWVLHGLVTLPDDPSRRWFRRPTSYLRTALLALAVDVILITTVVALVDVRSWPGLLVAKGFSLGCAFLVRVFLYRHTMFAEVRADQAHPFDRPAPPGTYRLSVVIPAYMEADRIAGSVEKVRTELRELASIGELELVVVDDGSSDQTAVRAREAGADIVISHDRNRGKGAAVRTGALAATGRVVAFTDADLSYPPAQLLELLTGVEAGWDVVVGSRRHIDTRTVVRAGRLRELGGRVINVLTEYVLLGRYRDTQCGLKAMRSDAAALILGRGRIDGFAFDVEMFALVERYRLALLEVPVSVVNSERSSVRIVRDAAQLVRDLFRIRTYARLGHYDIGEAEALPAPVGRTDGDTHGDACSGS